MTREEILSTVNKIFREAFDDEYMTVTEESNAQEIEDWDSLMQITLIAAVEDEFDVKFNMKDVLKMRNVGDMLALIQEKLA